MATLTTIDAVKRQLGITTYVDGTLTTNTDDDDVLQAAVDQASAMFQTEVRREFTATPGATLTYDLAPPDIYGSKLYFGADFLGVDQVYNGNGSLIPAANYVLLPNNGLPKYGLQMVNGNGQWYFNNNTGYKAAIVVNGTTGFCELEDRPSDVVRAVTKLAAWLYQTRDNTGDVVKFADGTMSIPGDVPSIVIQTIKNYRRPNLYP